MKSAKSSTKIILKVGSSVLASGKTELIPENLDRIVRFAVTLMRAQKHVAIASSGAIACGLSALGIQRRPSALVQLQAAAAVGQTILMQQYTMAFHTQGLRCAQVLLTRDDFHERKRYVNIKNTLSSLFALGVVPIINENDTVSNDEIKFGDNDMLSALVAMLIEADGLAILSDIEGLCRTYDRQKNTYRDLIKKVKQITPGIEIIAGGTRNAACIGGMESKIEAIKLATSVGIPVVLANGLSEQLHIDFDDPEASDGTFFEAHSKRGMSKKYWIVFGAKTKGVIIIDDGAKKALTTKPASLLSPGVTDCRGDFAAKSVIDIVDAQGMVVARGVTNFSRTELQEVKGKRVQKEVVHRDELVLLV